MKAFGSPAECRRNKLAEGIATNLRDRARRRLETRGGSHVWIAVAESRAAIGEAVFPGPLSDRILARARFFCPRERERHRTRKIPEAASAPRALNQEHARPPESPSRKSRTDPASSPHTDRNGLSPG